MATSKEEEKARLMAEASRIIDELLASGSNAGGMALTEIEDRVSGAGRRLETLLTQALVEAEEAREGRATCPECDAPMRHRGYREKRLVTRTGEVKVRRAYYRCETCASGFFPPG